MSRRSLIALAILMAASSAGWSQDDKAAKKKKKKAQADAAKVVKPKWEYKVVRADDLVPKAGAATATTIPASPGGTAPATAKDGPGAVADALNRLGEEGWELVWVDAPPRPIAGGMVGGLGGFGGSDAAAFGGGGAAGGANAAQVAADLADRTWDMMTRGKDTFDLSDPENKAVRDRLRQRFPDLPADGVLTKEKFQEAVQKRLTAGTTTRLDPAKATADQIRDVMRRYDQDGDGRISAAEAAQSNRLRDRFASSDKNKDGFLDVDEYRAYIAARYGEMDTARQNSATAEASPSPAATYYFKRAKD